MHYTILAIALEYFHIMTHSCVARFQMKPTFIKFTTFFISKQIYTFYFLFKTDIHKTHKCF